MGVQAEERWQRKPGEKKARLVVKGFGQKKGIDFDEIFSYVVKLSSIRIILGLATNQDLEIEQLDVKLHFSMVIWKKRSTCNNHKGLKSKGKKT